MKIGAVTPNFSASKISNHNQKKQNPAFKANVRMIQKQTDVISGLFMDLNIEPLKSLVNKVYPRLVQLDEGLEVSISGAANKATFFNVFKKPIVGLKFDVKYWDAKKFWNEIVNGGIQEAIMDPVYFEAIKNKDQTLASHLSDKVGVGKLYYPEKGETPELYAKEVYNMIQARLINIPNEIFSNASLQFNKETGKFDEVCGVYDYGTRRIWEKYRGIEYNERTFPYPKVY